MIIRRGSERVAMLVKAPPAEGERRIWGDLSGSLDPSFDDVPADFADYA